MITLMTMDEVLEEIKALPVGEKLSKLAMESIFEFYHDDFPRYNKASDYEKLIIDAMLDSLSVL